MAKRTTARRAERSPVASYCTRWKSKLQVARRRRATRETISGENEDVAAKIFFLDVGKLIRTANGAKRRQKLGRWKAEGKKAREGEEKNNRDVCKRRGCRG